MGQRRQHIARSAPVGVVSDSFDPAVVRGRWLVTTGPQWSFIIDSTNTREISMSVMFSERSSSGQDEFLSTSQRLFAVDHPTQDGSSAAGVALGAPMLLAIESCIAIVTFSRTDPVTAIARLDSTGHRDIHLPEGL